MPWAATSPGTKSREETATHAKPRIRGACLGIGIVCTGEKGLSQTQSKGAETFSRRVIYKVPLHTDRALTGRSTLRFELRGKVNF